MKHLYIIRHAKSDWSDILLSDHERDLNKRGKKDAPFMAKILDDKDLKIELIISSSATRAQKTAKIFADLLDVKLKIEDSMYEADMDTLLELILDAFKKYDSIALVGHNPTLNGLVEYFHINFTQNIPTCGIVAISFKNKKLDDAKLEFFEYPKKY